MKRFILGLVGCLLIAPAFATDCIPSGVTDQYTYFVAVDATDFTTRETGLSSFTVYRSRNGAAAAAFTTPTINETSSANMPGVYELLLDEDMTIDSGDDVQHMTVHITATGMAPVTKEFCIARAKVTAGETLTVSSGSGNAAVQSIAANAMNASALATDAVTEIQSGLATSSALTTVDTVVDAIKVTTDKLDDTLELDSTVYRFTQNALEEAPTGSGGSVDDGDLGIVASGTAQAGTSTTIQLASATSLADDLINCATVLITGGTGAGQARTITDWVSSTDTATVATWTTNPSSDSTYNVFGTACGSLGDGASLTAIPWNSAWDAEVESEVDDALGGGTGTALTSIPWNSAWDAEVQSEATDALNAYDPPTNAEMTARTLASASYATATALQTVDDNVDAILVDTGTTLDGKLDTIDSVADAIKAKTDSLTFTVTGQVDANSKSMNDEAVCGTGDSGTPWTGCE